VLGDRVQVMGERSRSTWRSGVLVIGLSLPWVGCATAPPKIGPIEAGSVRIELLALTTLPPDLEFEGTRVGGLSAISWTGDGNRYLVASDDPSEHAPARIYELEIERASAEMEVAVVSMTHLSEEKGNTFRRGTIDPEGIVSGSEGSFWLSSEGNAMARIGPSVVHYDSQGHPLRVLTVPPHYSPDPSGQGVRPNQGFESLTAAPGTHYLFTALEGALHEDGPSADVGVRTPSRVLRYELDSDDPPTEFRYWAEAVTRRPALPGAFRTAGLVELLALDAERLLALERSFGVGTGYTIRLFLASLAEATEIGAPVADGAAQTPEPTPIAKELLLDFADLGIAPRNLEGITFGPPTSDGRLTLVMVSDNNFRDGDRTQVIQLAIEF